MGRGYDITFIGVPVRKVRNSIFQSSRKTDVKLCAPNACVPA